tara:strand:+ start:10377 stop:11462 length:1086 start_codon:yes stop_codon:yes gene_type:complete
MFKHAENLWSYLREGNTYFIAEAGVNHLCRMDLAERLIKEAAAAGSECIKFQTYKAETLCIKEAPRFWDETDFDNFEEKEKDGSQYDSYSHLDSFEEEEHRQMKEICQDNGIEFMSTPFDFHAVDYLDKLSDVGFKVASCDITNLPFLRYVAKKNKIVFLSTGASDIEEIDTAIEAISKFNDKIVVMHCNLCYPTKDEDANLGMITHLKSVYGDKYIIGLSDHTTNLMTPAYAYLLGATVFERHYTVDKTLGESPDNSFGVDPAELKQLIANVNSVRKMVGETHKRCTPSELSAKKFARRSVVTLRDIRQNEVFTTENIGCKRPGTGISPINYDNIIGKKAATNIESDKLLSETQIKGDLK